MSTRPPLASMALAFLFWAILPASPGAAHELDALVARSNPGLLGLFRTQASPVPRQLVMLEDKYAPGTVVIWTKQRRLYFVMEGGRAMEYGVGVGRDGFTWAGGKTVTMKREWPRWTPPAQMLKRRPDLPRSMPGGIDNPLGARAMYLGSSLYRIHGSNEPGTIGEAVSSGCIRMTNEDVMDLYERVKVGTKVVVRN